MIKIAIDDVSVGVAAEGYTVTGTVYVSEDELNQYVSGTIETSGNPIVVFSGRNIASTFRFAALGGPQLITVRAKNQRHPKPDTTFLHYTADIPDPVGFSSLSQTGTLYGPVLPITEAQAASWNMDKGYDIDVIKSAVKMLLITGRGERLMDPGYGTRLSKVVFNSPTDDVDSIVFEEISGALQRYEPRAKLLQVNVGSPVEGKVLINAVFSTNFGQSFDLNISFVQ